MKKFLTAVCAMLLACSAVFAFGCAQTPQAPVKKEFDMYLIGGQSNAVGFTRIEDYYSIDAQYQNIWYAGGVEPKYDTGACYYDNFGSFDEYYHLVEVGYGKDLSYIGPEYGMAQVLNEKYGGETKAFFYKYAAGGTAVRNVTHNAGNWYPRSQWPADMVTEGNYTGFLYREFVNNFRNVYNTLVAEGYTVNVRGMVWMQGESDLGSHNEYKTLMTHFIADIRADVVEITGDASLATMPFVMGKIALNYYEYANPDVPPMNAVQEALANEITNVYTVETLGLSMVNEQGEIVGSDRHHFNQADMVTLGKRFGNKLVDEVLERE